MARADAATCEKLSSYADNFIKLVDKKFAVKLDCSEESLVVADDLISVFFKLRKSHYYTASTIIGAYLGSVIIRNIGGRWGKDLSIEKIGSAKGVAHPLIRSRKRLAVGKSSSLTFYVSSLKLSNNRDTDFASDTDKIKQYYSSLRAEGWDRKLLERVLNESEKKYVREESADILGRLGDENSVPRLLQALKEPKNVYYAVIAVQGISDSCFFEPLLALLKKTRSPVLKMQLALALGAIGNEDAAPFLISLLHDDNEIINHYASMGLARLKGDKVVSLLLNALVSLPLEKMVYAVFPLGEIGDCAAVPSLIESLFSREESLREAAAAALQNIPDDRAFRPLTFLVKDRSYRMRTLAAYALASFASARVLPYIQDMLKDDVLSVRHHADKLLYWLERGIKPPRCI